MRTFVAIDLPEDLKKSIANFIRDLQKLDVVDASFTKPEQLHLTLKFLGEVKEEDVEKIKNVLANITRNAKKFELQLMGFGHFNYRILWIGGNSGQQQAIELANKIDLELNKLGFEKETRPFEVHLTLARVKWWKNKDALKDLLEKYRNKVWGTFAVDEIKLMKSTLSRQGPIYETIEKFIF